MPLVPFNQSHVWGTDGRQATIVFTEGERSMGLVVDEIIDIVEDRVAVELKADQAGLVGTAVVAGRATDVIDAAYYLTMAFSDWFGRAGGGKTLKHTESGTSDGRGGQRLLLVDRQSVLPAT